MTGQPLLSLTKSANWAERSERNFPEEMALSRALQEGTKDAGTAGKCLRPEDLSRIPDHDGDGHCGQQGKEHPRETSLLWLVGMERSSVLSPRQQELGGFQWSM